MTGIVFGLSDRGLQCLCFAALILKGRLLHLAYSANWLLSVLLDVSVVTDTPHLSHPCWSSMTDLRYCWGVISAGTGVSKDTAAGVGRWSRKDIADSVMTWSMCLETWRSNHECNSTLCGCCTSSNSRYIHSKASFQTSAHPLHGYASDEFWRFLSPWVDLGNSRWKLGC